MLEVGEHANSTTTFLLTNLGLLLFPVMAAMAGMELRGSGVVGLAFALLESGPVHVSRITAPAGVGGPAAGIGGPALPEAAEDEPRADGT